MPFSKNLPIVNLTPVILKTLFTPTSNICSKKHIHDMGMNRKFDFRQDGKFCWDLSDGISGGNWLIRWDCIFRWDFVPLCKL